MPRSSVSSLSRRRFLSTGALAATGVATLPLAAQAAPARPRIAFLGTVVFEHSHSQHFLDRLALGYAWRGGWEAPRVEVAGLYVDQFPDWPRKDLARGRAQKYGLTLRPNVADALTLGTGTLAVDGVVIIAEHGEYPRTATGQTRYPRYRWFKECVKIFESSGRAVPVFMDKHLSTTWRECLEMVEDSRRLGFPLHAGSSLPVTLREPALDMPLDAPLVESVCVAYGGPDSYDFHGLETAQCMSERRKGGEAGIVAVQALRGERLWEALAAPDRQVTRELIVAALARSHNLPVEGGYPTAPVSFDWARTACANSTGYLVEHADGFRTTVLLAPIRDFNYAGRRADTEETISCQMVLPMPTWGAATADFFTPLVRHIEEMILTGQAPYPVERTLLTSGMVVAGVESLVAGGRRVETPEMAIAYRANPESTFWQP
ncbi:MAG: hypothetical protein EBR86_07730 [Planctomycetia bacterium]|nr:hypothetical protein [Planctomycetia bacterium]